MGKVIDMTGQRVGRLTVIALQWENYRGVTVIPFSTDPDDYSPRCRPCHKAHDVAWRTDGREQAS